MEALLEYDKNITLIELHFKMAYFLQPGKHWDFVRADGFVRPYLPVYSDLLLSPEASEVVQTHHLLESYAVPTLATWGILTNAITLMVLLCSHARKLSGMQYICALVASDLVFMCVVLLVWVADMPSNHDSFYLLGGWCQFISYGSHICTFLHVWCTVALCVDRLIYVLFPEASKRLCTPLKAKAVLSALIMLAVVVYLNTSLLERRKTFFFRYICSEMKTFEGIISILRKMELAFNMALPYAAVFVCTLIIIGRLIWIRASMANRSALHSRQQDDVTRVCVVYALALLLLTGPAQGLRVYHLHQSGMPDQPVLSPKILQIENILLLIFYFRAVIHLGLLSASSRVFQHSLRSLYCRNGSGARRESPESEVPLTVTRDSNA